MLLAFRPKIKQKSFKDVLPAARNINSTRYFWVFLSSAQTKNESEKLVSGHKWRNKTKNGKLRELLRASENVKLSVQKSESEILEQNQCSSI